jgi:hypothetical protein
VGQWNYWHNLMVTPNTTLAKGFYKKWSQPPVVIDPNDPPVFLGWNELSDYEQGPILADDWLCKDDRPVTDVHWWGSYPGWNRPFPPALPSAFHIGIWTNVPDPDPCDPHTYSQPGVLVWENHCDNYVWEFTGFDKDPREVPTHPDPEFKEAKFQFTQLLSQDEWFFQDPNYDGDGDGRSVYWVSIAPIWGPTTYQWGWETRPHYFEDDAVRIWGVIGPDGIAHWPPTVRSKVSNADPILDPPDPLMGISWDLSFEITTNEPTCADVPIPGDLNRDCKVDLADLKIMADHWLQMVPVP